MSNEHKRATDSRSQGQGKWLMRVEQGRCTGRMSDMNSHVGGVQPISRQLLLAPNPQICGVIRVADCAIFWFIFLRYFNLMPVDIWLQRRQQCPGRHLAPAPITETSRQFGCPDSCVAPNLLGDKLFGFLLPALMTS